MASPDKKPDDSPTPPRGPAWHTRALAVASGAAVVALPLIELEFWPALFAGEALSVGVSAANRLGEAEMTALREWHMALVRQDAGKLVDALAAKPASTFTDADRIQLALLADWGLVDEKRAKNLSPGHQAEILFTQIMLGCKQQGVGILKMAEHFALPRLDPDSYATPEGLAALTADREKLRQWKNAPPDSRMGKLGRKGASLVGNLLPGPLKRAVPIGFELPSLRKLWNVATAKGAAPSSQDFMNRVAREMQGSFNAGFSTYRCAIRRNLRQAGIPHESVSIPKTGGGKRLVVRPKNGPKQP